MKFKNQDAVVLNQDLPSLGLRKGDLGAVVVVYPPDRMDVEFVTGSGDTEALVTLGVEEIRHASERDLVAVRPLTRRSA